MDKQALIGNIERLDAYVGEVRRYLHSLHELYRNHQISHEQYQHKLSESVDGRTPTEWLQYSEEQLVAYRQQLLVLTESESIQPRGKRIAVGLAIGVILFLGMLTFLSFSPTLTGFSIHAPEPVATHTDGFGIEGQKWVDIRGQHFYERCLQVSSSVAFQEAVVQGKIMSATDEVGLQFTLYSSDLQSDEPGLPLGSCNVDGYGKLWKSCSISDLGQPPGDYWICASHSQEDYGTTYSTIAYSSNDLRRTAFWTGQHWQKLDRNSYSLRVVFNDYGSL